MTYEEIIQKLGYAKKFNVIDEKITGNSKQIKLSNGAIGLFIYVIAIIALAVF